MTYIWRTVLDKAKIFGFFSSVQYVFMNSISQQIDYLTLNIFSTIVNASYFRQPDIYIHLLSDQIFQVARHDLKNSHSAV